MKHLRRLGIGAAVAVTAAIVPIAPAAAASNQISASGDPVGFLAWWAAMSIVAGSAVIAVAMHRAFRVR